MCKGYLVSRKYFKIRGNFTINTHLDKFLLLRKDIEFQLAHLLWFVWKTYKGRKARLLREEEERKAKKKGKGKKKKGSRSFSTRNANKASFKKADSIKDGDGLKKRGKSTANAIKNLSDVAESTTEGIASALSDIDSSLINMVQKLSPTGSQMSKIDEEDPNKTPNSQAGS